jgi:hypothetical protein
MVGQGDKGTGGNYMKILYLEHPEEDKGSYFLFSGLCEILGDKNVITFPLKKIYYGEIASDYILDDGMTGFTAPPEYIVPRGKVSMRLDEILNNMEDFDFIVLASPRTYAINALRSIMDIFNRKLPVPLIMCDNQDGDDIRTDLIDEFKPAVLFKRELIKGKEHSYKGQKIYPLPFSAAINSFPQIDDMQKEYDMFGLFGYTHALRKELVIFLLNNYGDNNIYIGIDTDLPADIDKLKKNKIGYQEYLKKIAKSKIAFSIRGFGRDTVRAWEVCYYETCMFYCQPGIEIPYDFKAGRHAVHFKDDFSDLKQKIDYYLSHDDERVAIAKAGKEHLLKYHTNKARAEYFLSILEQEEVI